MCTSIPLRLCQISILAPSSFGHSMIRSRRSYTEQLTTETNRRRAYSVRKWWHPSVRYVLFAAVALAIGISVNIVAGGVGERIDAIRRSSLSELYLLLALYAGAHLMLLGITLGFRHFLDAKVWAISAAVASTLFFALSLIIFDPFYYQGLHFFVILSLSVFLIAADNLWRTYRRSGL